MPEAEPAVVTLEPVTTAVIRRVVPMDRLPEFFDGSFGALAAAVQEQDAGVAGPAFAFYHRLPTDTADLEVGFPTRRAVTATGDVRGGPASDTAGRYAALRKLLSTRIPKGQNLVISSHGNPFHAVAGPPYLAEGEMAVVKPEGERFSVIARIRLTDW